MTIVRSVIAVWMLTIALFGTVALLTAAGV